MALIEMVYASAATVRFSDADLEALLAVARSNNARLGISGILLYQDGSFFQILEGEEAAVASLYARVENDDRHANVMLLRKRKIQTRSFAEWQMGFVRVKPGELEGFSNFLQSGWIGDVADEVDAVVRGFRDGRWRRRVA